MDAISINRLTKHYGTRRVVDIVNLRIPTGCVYGFLGRNGAGKSTLIKMLLGMVQPDAGHATLLGESISDLRPATRGRIAYLAEGHPIYRWMTVAEAVRFTRRFYTTWHDDFLKSILEHFHLGPRQKIGRLSNGQRAQVSLALALASDPELLILDDPTLGLDTVVRRDFLESMIDLIHAKAAPSFSARTSWAMSNVLPIASASCLAVYYASIVPPINLNRPFARSHSSSPAPSPTCRRSLAGRHPRVRYTPSARVTSRGR